MTAWRPAGMRFRRTGPMGRSSADLCNCCRVSLGFFSGDGPAAVDISAEGVRGVVDIF